MHAVVRAAVFQSVQSLCGHAAGF